MWYVIQTKSGDEDKIKTLFESRQDDATYVSCFIPLFEEVRRRSDKYAIIIRRMFPGYLFVDTDKPDEIFKGLKKIPDFTKLLGFKEDDGELYFIPVSPEDEKFLLSLLDDGIMHVSYVHLSKNNRIDKIVGPLSGYRNHIVKLEFRRRTAAVELDMFGRKRRINFGLWTDGDPEVPWLRQQMLEDESPPLDRGVSIDIGLKPGDRVIDESGVYEGLVFTVERVDPARRSVYTTFNMLGANARLMLNADYVRKVAE